MVKAWLNCFCERSYEKGVPVKKPFLRIVSASLAVIASSVTVMAATYTSHAYESVLNGIELGNACLTAERVQTIKALTVCEEKKEITLNDGINTSTDFVCVKWSSQNLSYSRKYTTKECTQMIINEGDVSCKKYENKTHLLPQTIKVRTWTENKDYNNYPGSVSDFTFPNCK